MCDCVRFSVGSVWGACAELCAVLCVACMHCAVMLAQSAVVVAVRGVVRACGACVFVCCV